MINIEAAGIDFDGTLANTRAAMTGSRLESFASMAVELNDERYAQVDPAIHAEAHHHGSHAFEIFGWVLLQAGIVKNVSAEADTVQHIVDRRNEIYWDKGQHGFDEIPGAVETITKLHERLGDKLSIVTTAPLEKEVAPFLRRYDLTDMFEPQQLITREDVAALKPSPEAYLLAINRMQVDPDRFIALEDAVVGVLSGRRAGIKHVAALTTSHTIEQFNALPCDEQPTIITPTHADFQKTFLN